MVQIANALLKIGQSSDEDSWKLVVNNLSTSMWKITRSVLFDDSLAEDAVQESFLQIKYLLSENKEKFNFDNDNAACAWVLRVTFFTAKDMMKSRNRKLKHEKSLILLNSNLSNEINDAEEQEKLHKELTRCIQTLPEKLREPLMLKYFSGLTYQKISDLMGTQVSTIKSRVQKGISLLKSKIVKSSVILLGLNIPSLLDSLEASTNSITCDQDLLSLCEDLIYSNQLPSTPLNNATLSSPLTLSLIGEIGMFLKSIPGIILLTSTLAISAYVVQSKDLNSPEQKPNETVIENKAKNNVAKIKKEEFEHSEETADESIVSKKEIKKTPPIELKEKKIRSPIQEVLDQLDASFMLTAVFPDIKRSLKRYQESSYNKFYTPNQLAVPGQFILDAISLPQNDETFKNKFLKSLKSGSVQINPSITRSDNNFLDMIDFVITIYLEDPSDTIWEQLKSSFNSLKINEFDALLIKENKDGDHKIFLKRKNLLIIGRKSQVQKTLKNKNHKIEFKNDFKNSDMSLYTNLSDFKKELAYYLRPDKQNKKNSEYAMNLLNFALGGLKEIKGNYKLGKNKTWEDVEFNFNGSRGGYWSLFQLKNFPENSSFKLSEKCYEKTRIMFDLPSVWKNYQNLISSMSKIKDLAQDATGLQQMHKAADSFFKLSGTSLEELTLRQLTGEVRGWVTLVDHKPIRHFWLGLKVNKTDEKISHLLKQINLSSAFYQKGLLISQPIPTKVLTKKGNLLQIDNGLKLKNISAQAYSVTHSDLSLKFGFELLPIIMNEYRNHLAIDMIYNLNQNKKKMHTLFNGTYFEANERDDYLRYKTGGYLSYTSAFFNELVFTYSRKQKKYQVSTLTPFNVNYNNGNPMISGYLEPRSINSSYDYSRSIPDELEKKFLVQLVLTKNKANLHKNHMVGKWVFYHKNRTKHLEANFSKGIPQGPIILFSEKGLKVKESNFSPNGREGMYNDWYSNGQLKTTGDYKGGKKQSHFKTYADSGQLLRREILIDTDLWKKESFYLDGSRSSTYYTKNNGSYQGEFNQWALNGQLIENGNYNKNKVGKWFGFYKTGEAKYEVTYEKGNGSFESWYADGKIKSKGLYVNHMKNGPWKYFWPNGNLKLSGSFQQRQKIHQWSLYHSNGNLMLKINHFGRYIVYPVKLYNQEGDLVLNENGPKNKIPGVTRVPYEKLNTIDKLAGYKGKNYNQHPFYFYNWGLNRVDNGHSTLLYHSDKKGMKTTTSIIAH